MYRPYFRGKQYELITIRECAGLFAGHEFVPIIEPVKESIGGLKKALSAVLEADGRAIVIVNPFHGDYGGGGGGPISELIEKEFSDRNSILVGVLLRSDMQVGEAVEICKKHTGHDLALVHSGFTDPRMLSERLADSDVGISEHVFVEEHANLLYRRHFPGATRSLVRDGFKRQRNADYQALEMFSELHVTYNEIGMDGFGDFLIVGDEYSETGGPAYAVAIHLTFVDPERDDVMYIYHFVSDTNDTPTDPAGKFAEALQKLIDRLDSGNSKLIETDSIKEFRALHGRGHFPGLGFVKKLSMKHHIETLAHYRAL